MNRTHSPSIPPRGARGSTVRAGACLLALASASGVARAQEGQGVPPPTEPPKTVTVEPTPVQDETTPEERRTQRLTRPRRVRASEPRVRVGGGVGYGHFEINASELGRRDDAFKCAERPDLRRSRPTLRRVRQTRPTQTMRPYCLSERLNQEDPADSQARPTGLSPARRASC